MIEKNRESYRLGADKYAEINQALAKLWQEKSVLVTAHRGVGAGIIMENTVESAKLAFASGADIVEFDVVKSTDNGYWVFHDGYEKLWLNLDKNISVLSNEQIKDLYFDLHEVNNRRKYIDDLPRFLNALRGQFLTCDRSQRYWEQGFLDVLDEVSDPKYLILKSEVTPQALRQLAAHTVKYPYMPVVRNLEEIDQVLECKEINCVGFEVLTDDPQHVFASETFFQTMRNNHFLVLVNCQGMEDGRVLFCGWDDCASVLETPESGWDKCIELGATIIHTDCPWLVAQRISK